jgi:microcystin-dependent protein
MASQPYIGAIFIFAGNFAPVGFELCQGQLLPIAQNTALFSILGTTYGGNGTTTFGLPDLRGRMPIGQGNGPGLSPVVLGEASGVDNVTILQNNMPIHNHLINAVTGVGNQAGPGANLPAQAAASVALTHTPSEFPGIAVTPDVYSNGAANTTMAPNMVTNAGGNVPINVQNPFLGINFIIAIVGIFPSRG